ncbi:MAG: hypothetical protein HOV79_00665 [Hamadaea sp.]|nr:hypothetical protein [Hamadaea sp.]
MSFLADAVATPETDAMYADDLREPGFVMNLTHVWAHQPELQTLLFQLIGRSAKDAGLSVRERGILTTACASTRGDSYCSIAWGAKLAKAADADTAAGVLSGDDSLLSPAEQALAAWARKVAADPNGTSAADVQTLRDAGYADAQIVAITVYLGLRMAFSTVNDALGAAPDAEYRTLAPEAVLDAVTFGRPLA